MKACIRIWREEEEEDPTEQIFGHNIFTNPYLTFEPSMNIATPANYQLGPGDEVIIDVWGGIGNHHPPDHIARGKHPGQQPGTGVPERENRGRSQ